MYSLDQDQSYNALFFVITIFEYNYSLEIYKYNIY